MQDPASTPAFDIEAVLDSMGDHNPSQATSKTPSHFGHAQKVIGELKTIGSLPMVGPCQWDQRQRWAARMSLVGSLAGYQYQSYLLDPYIEDMVTPLINPIRKVVHDLTVGNCQGQVMNEQGDEVFHMLYFITKTRGYKTIVKFLPHEVSDLEPAFQFLKMQSKRQPTWETRYMLFVWLSLMCMIPFDLKSIDSQSSKLHERIPLVDQMMDTAKQYLDCAGKDRDGASLFLARLLTRKDTCQVYLPEFVEWSGNVLKNDPNIFEAIGILGTLCWIFKIGQREILLPIAQTMDDILVHVESMERLISNSSIKKLIVKLSQRIGLCLLKPRVASWRYQRGNRSLVSNLSQEPTGAAIGQEKISLTIAQETDDDDDFEVPEAVENVIERLMNGLRDRDTIVRWSAAKGMGRMSNRLPKEMADDVVGGIFELFSEDVFQLPNGEPDISSVSEHTWHGACLAIAELSRRGLLLPHRLAELIPWIIMALKFDVKRGAHSVGSNVRDASCYVCWSFARAYTPDILEAHVRKLSNTLIAVSVFDRDINIRRASSAAFQENVGRMGIFPHGIEIVTVADYFSIGNINNSFLTVAPFIAGFVEYRRHLAEHLIESVIPHWDIAVREVAAESMARIAVLDLNYACSDIIPALTKMAASLDPNFRHGALIALGRTCKAVKAHSEKAIDQRLSPETLQAIANIVPSIPEYALSGFGSEHVRQALCVYMTCLAEAGWPMTQQGLVAWKSITDSTLERPEEVLQKLASETFKAVVAQYGIEEQELERCLKKVAPAAERFGKRGYALALGEINYAKPGRHVWAPKVITTLAKTASLDPSLSGDIADAESRRNATFAVTNIIGVLGKSYRQVITPEISQSILQMYFVGLQDYSVDHRGDIGSWVREASMQGLGLMLPLVAQLDRDILAGSSLEQHESERYLSDHDHVQVLAKLLQQSVEKIDRVRACAAAEIVNVLYARAEERQSSEGAVDAYLLRVPHREKVMKVIEKEEYVNWLQASEVYSRVVNLLHLPEYRAELLVGYIVSAGGLTETLVRHASSCLAEFVGNLAITTDDATMTGGVPEPSLTLVEFGNEIMSLVERYEGQDRVIVPLLEVLDMLFESGVLLMMEGHYDFAPMVRFVRRQTIKCKDTRKLSACIRVYCGLCGLGGRIKAAIQLELLRLLVHPFPKIRRTTADAMYLMLSGSVDEPTKESEKVGEILVSSDWNLSVSQLTPLRDQLYPLLGLEKPKLASKK